MLPALAIVVVIFATAPMQAEIYKYTDPSGNIHFTDDINQVPEDQREGVTSYVEAESGSEEDTGSPSTVEATEPGKADSHSIPAGEDEQPPPLNEERARLEAMKMELDEEYRAIMEQKKELDQQRDKLKTREDILEYNERVEKLNERAEAYEQKGNEYRRQVEEYNQRISQTETGGKQD
jgi:chromosome segregation ATPase